MPLQSASGDSQPNSSLSLHEAASQGLTSIMLHRLREGAAIDEPNGNGLPALGLAISEGHIKAVRVLLN